MSFLLGLLTGVIIGAATLGSVMAIALVVVFVTTASYVLLPVLALDFTGVWILAILALAIGGGVAFWTRHKQDRASPRRRAAIGILIAAPVLLGVLIVTSFVTTASLFRAQAYATLIGPVQTVPFAQAIQRLDTTGHLMASDQTVIDPQSCTTTRYGMNAIPAWVNRVIPDDLAWEQAPDWAELSGGWLNASPFGAHAGVKLPTPGIELVATTAPGATGWYMGLATASKPQRHHRLSAHR